MSFQYWAYQTSKCEGYCERGCCDGCPLSEVNGAHWIDIGDGKYKCSECGYVSDKKEEDCPKCGEIMNPEWQKDLEEAE